MKCLIIFKTIGAVVGERPHISAPGSVLFTSLQTRLSVVDHALAPAFYAVKVVKLGKHEC
jgi:hypothetical protein